MHSEPNYFYYLFIIVIFAVIVFSEYKKGRSLKKISREFLIAFLIIFSIRSFLFDIFIIPSGSMVNNLLVGDIPVVKKYSYGYSPFSLWLSEFLYPNLKSDVKFFESSPKRGDIFVFRLPKDPSINYVKRVVGLPGDKVQVINGDIYINDQRIERKYVGEYDYDNDENPDLVHFMNVFEEKFPGEEKPHNIIMLTQDELNTLPYKNYIIDKQNTLPYYVPKDHYFGMGDNRDFSNDCRNLAEVGFIHKRYIIGKVAMVLFSMGNRVTFYEPWKWLQNIRYNSLFKIVE